MHAINHLTQQSYTTKITIAFIMIVVIFILAANQHYEHHLQTL